jgi:hypothetical protein
MQQPNWFDTKYSGQLEKASAHQALELVAKDGRVQKAIDEALKNHDQHAKQPGWVGPSRSQVIRKAVAECLSAQS